MVLGDGQKQRHNINFFRRTKNGENTTRIFALTLNFRRYHTAVKRPLKQSALQMRSRRWLASTGRGIRTATRNRQWMNCCRNEVVLRNSRGSKREQWRIQRMTNMLDSDTPAIQYTLGAVSIHIQWRDMRQTRRSRKS